MAVSLRDHLRRETGAMHEEVEAAFAQHDLTQPEGLGDTLRAHIRAMARLLPSMSDAPGYRQEIERLLDLARSSYTQVSDEPVESQGTSSRLHPFAVAYVILGSRLGSRVITARLKRAGIEYDNPAFSYFTDDQSRQHWQDLLRALEDSGDQADTILADTTSAFNIFREEALGARAVNQVPS